MNEDSNEEDGFNPDAENDAEMSEMYDDIERKEHAELQRQIEGGDSDDYDEEDSHGSHPIDDPEDSDTGEKKANDEDDADDTDEA